MIDREDKRITEIEFYTKICTEEVQTIRKNFTLPIEKSLQNIEKKVEKISRLINEDAGKYIMADPVGYAEEQIHSCLNDLGKLCCRNSVALMKRYAAHPLDRYCYTKEQIAEQEKIMREEYCRAFVHDEIIYIKIPRLPRKYFKSTSDFSEKEAGRFFQNDVRESLISLPEFDINTKEGNDFFYRFCNKHIYFLHNVPDEKNIRDNDNYDTKGALNGICTFLPGGDVGSKCKLTMYSIRNDFLPEATYIMIAPGSKKMPEDEEIIDTWVKYFEKNNPKKASEI